MDPLASVQVDCPYCGASLEITVDVSAGRQEYIEDCQGCCKPMQLRVRVGADGTPSVDARREDE